MITFCNKQELDNLYQENDDLKIAMNLSTSTMQDNIKFLDFVRPFLCNYEILNIYYDRNGYISCIIADKTHYDQFMHNYYLDALELYSLSACMYPNNINIFHGKRGAMLNMRQVPNATLQYIQQAKQQMYLEILEIQSYNYCQLGHGTALMETIKQIAQSRQIPKITAHLTSSITCDIRDGWYQTCGFILDDGVAKGDGRAKFCFPTPDLDTIDNTAQN